MSDFTNSPLVNLVNLSPHRNSPREQPIRKITIHHFAGNLSIEAVSDFLRQPGTNASYNYGIGTDGRIVLIVNESDRCWASSSAANDNQAVVIGVANSTGAPNWEVSETAFEAMINLVKCICTRNGITELVYDGTANGTLTRHNFFAATACPGPFLQARFPEIMRRVNDFLCLQTLAPDGRVKDAQSSKVTKDNAISPDPEQTERFPLTPENVRNMVEMGVIISPEYWLTVDSVQWLDELLAQAGKADMLHLEVENGISDLDTALHVLKMAEIINHPSYWQEQVQNGSVRFLGQLIINMANRCRDPLHRIVWAEARGEDIQGQTLVANVIFNRHKDESFPNGIYNVIFQTNQFEPTRNGVYERATPTDMNKEAVFKALSGTDYSRGALFFDSAPNSWARQSRKHLFDHGGHSFFA